MGLQGQISLRLGSWPAGPSSKFWPEQRGFYGRSWPRSPLRQHPISRLEPETFLEKASLSGPFWKHRRNSAPSSPPASLGPMGRELLPWNPELPSPLCSLLSFPCTFSLTSPFSPGSSALLSNLSHQPRALSFSHTAHKHAQFSPI